MSNSDIVNMLHTLSSYLTLEVETHNAKNWNSEDALRLYECLQKAIQ